jgi:lysophospholipase L1-like esterase
MSSSTSSSRLSPRARGLRVALMVAAALLLIEWATRASVMPGTGDLARYGSFPERARTLAASPEPRIVFIGNSVTDRVRLDILRSEWQELTGEELTADKFVAYYSNLATWYRMSAQFFWKQELKPDLIVVTYYEGNLLADSEAMDVGNLALFFTGPEDRPSLFANDLTTVEQRTDYLLSSTSETFASRDRIRARLLNLIPGYRPFATATNALNFEHEKRLARTAPQPPRTFHTLASFLAGARESGVTVCFVASPSRPDNGPSDPYVISPKAREMIADAGMLHLDLRGMDSLSAAMYNDNVHLNARGRPVYTRKLARALNEAWKAR